MIHTETSSRPPAEPAPIVCPNCMFVAHVGEPHCPSCENKYPPPTFNSMIESDEWCAQNHRDTMALHRWQTWLQRQSLMTVPASHPRYAAWMAFRCYLLAQVFLRRVDGDQVAHIAAVVVLGVERHGGFWLFGDIVLGAGLAGHLYRSDYDGKDHGMAGALLSLYHLLDDPLDSRDDILLGDHAVIKGAFQ